MAHLLTLFVAQEYLTQMGIDVADSQLKRWHPDFPLHEVADVPATPLPAAPKCEEIASAHEVLARFQHKMEAEDTVAPVVSTPTPEARALKGVPVHLIEKVCDSSRLHVVCAVDEASAHVGQTARG